MSFDARGNRMRRVALALGSDDNPYDDDFDSSSTYDPRTDYVAWAAAVTKAGGEVSVMPHINAGLIAAKYKIDVIYPPPGYALNPMFSRAPDDWSADSGYGYYRAPDAVVRYQTSGGILQPQSVPGEPEPAKPDWYENIIIALKLAGVIVGGLVVLEIVDHLPGGHR